MTAAPAGIRGLGAVRTAARTEDGTPLPSVRGRGVEMAAAPESLRMSASAYSARGVTLT